MHGTSTSAVCNRVNRQSHRRVENSPIVVDDLVELVSVFSTSPTAGKLACPRAAMNGLFAPDGCSPAMTLSSNLRRLD